MFPNVLSTWIRGLLSVAILVAGVLLVKKWVDELPQTEPVPRVAPGSQVLSGASGAPAPPGPSETQAPPGPSGTQRPLHSLPDRLGTWWREPDRPVAPLAWGVALLLLAVAGRVVSPRLWKRSSPEPRIDPDHVERLETRNGHRLQVQTFGPAHGPPVILVHGLGSDHTQWLETIEDLSREFRVIAYDLLGHGDSDRQRWSDHSMESMAEDLEDVMTLAGDRKVVVVGHSMGGMIALTWCGMNPRKVQDRLAGMVLVHTTPRNPFETMAPVPLHRVLQKPVIEPLLRLTTFVAPVVALMNRLSYWNGSTHWNNELSLFAGRETREQLDRTARLATRMDTASHARFSRAMTRYDAMEALRTIDLPTLVVAADKDGVTVPDASETIAERIRGAEYALLAPAKHMGFLEQREQFGEAVETFAREVTKSPGRAAR